MRNCSLVYSKTRGKYGRSGEMSLGVEGGKKGVGKCVGKCVWSVGRGVKSVLGVGEM